MDHLKANLLLDPPEAENPNAGVPEAERLPPLARRPVSVRLSDREITIVAREAKRRGMAPTAYVRCAALLEAGRPVPAFQRNRDAMAVEVARGVGMLGRIASSANQVARVSNRGGLQPHEVAFVLKQLERQLSEARASLVLLAEVRGG